MLRRISRPGRALRRLAQDERGLSTAEYLIILILIGVIAILAWKTFGQAAGEKADEATASVQGLRNAGQGEVQGASIRDRRPTGVQGAQGAGGPEGSSGTSAEGGAAGREAGQGAAAGGSGDGSGVYGAGEQEEEGGSNALLIVAVILFAFFASLPFIARMKKG